jgi:hypothetical protein
MVSNSDRHDIDFDQYEFYVFESHMYISTLPLSHDIDLLELNVFEWNLFFFTHFCMIFIYTSSVHLNQQFVYISIVIS